MNMNRFTQRVGLVTKVVLVGSSVAFLGAACWKGVETNGNVGVNAVANENTNTVAGNVNTEVNANVGANANANTNENTNAEVNTNVSVNTNTNTDSTGEIDTSDWLTYTNEEYGFSFRYPEEFGPIDTLVDKGCLGRNLMEDDPCQHISLFFPNLGSDTLFLSSSTPKYVENPPGRGGYWGDDAGLITNESFVKNYCIQNESESCTTYQTDNGIFVSKTKCLDLYCSTDSNLYFIKSNHELYYGIIISSDRLIKKGINNANAIVDEMVDSLTFVSLD